MDGTKGQQTPDAADLLRELDRLVGRTEEALRTLAGLRQERDRLLAASGVRSTQALLQRIAAWKRAEEENAELRAERREAASRLRLLMDKVDMLPRES